LDHHSLIFLAARANPGSTYRIWFTQRVPQNLRAGGRTQVRHGPYVLFEFADGDLALRNMALVALTESGAQSVKDTARQPTAHGGSPVRLAAPYCN
jgi:hypothetical protein